MRIFETKSDRLLGAARAAFLNSSTVLCEPMKTADFPIPVKAVTIDLDGTLLDTIKDLTTAVNLLFLQLGRAPLEEALVRTFVGKGIANLVRRSLASGLNSEPDVALLERALPIYMDCYESVNGKHTTIYAGVREGLDALRRAGFPLA